MKGNTSSSSFSPAPVRHDVAKDVSGKSLARPGREIAPSVRAPFEQRFGQDFSQVRVHDDGQAASLAKGHHAKALTAGGDIFFSRGRYAPGSSEGQSLLGHELAHVAQQRQGGPASGAEARADHAADKAGRGEQVGAAELGGAPPSLQAKPEKETADAPPVGQGFSNTLSGFAFDSDVLTAAHLKEIDQMAFSVGMHAGMLRSGRVKIAITGHTDTAGSEQYNTGLGQRRADHAKAALAEALARQHGMDKVQIADIEATSAGEGKPQVPTKDNVKEPRNRRVEITISISSLPAPPRTERPDLTRIPGLGLPPIPTPVPDLKIPTIKPPSQEWLENHFKDDPILRKLPKPLHDKLVGALKDADELLAEKIIDALPIEQKAAVTAAVKALLEVLKGRKFKPPTPPPVQPDFGPQQQPFPKMPGEHIFKLPPITLPPWLGG